MFLLNLLPVRTLSLQARKPSGWIGRFMMTRIFNRGNAELNDLTLKTLDLESGHEVLELGFGPGQLVALMAQTVSNGHVFGLDFSPVMLEVATRHNRRAIQSGRVTLTLGNGNALPYDNDTFDRLCTCNTVYFMEDPATYFAEFARVARPGARICIGYRDAEEMNRLPLEKDILTTYTSVEIETLLTTAGFQNPDTTRHNSHTMHACVTSATAPTH